MAAYRTAAGEIVVYRLPTGKDAPGEAEVHARFPLTGALPSVFQALFGRSFFVADDGNRLVFRGENQMAVLEKAWSGVTVRKIPYVDTDSSQYAFGTPPAKLLGDGKTFVQIDQFLADRGRAPQVRVWDVSRDPNRFVPENVPSTGSVTVRRDGQWVRTLAVPGGHVSLEWPGREPKDGEPDPTNFRGRDDIPDVFTGPFVVRDAGDKVLGKVTDVPGSYRLTAQTLAEGRRLFVHYRFPTGGLVVGGKRQSVELAYQWRLYDLDNRAREIDGGSGTWMRPEGAPYFLEVPGQADGTRLLRTHLILRDGRTGDPIGRVQLPNRSVSFCDFDPTGRTFLVQSVAVAPDVPPAPRRVLSTAELAVTGAALGGNPRPGPLLPVGPEGSRFEYLGVQPQIRLHLFDVATHKELHAWDIAPENFLFVASTARFSPDGRRILFRYVTGTPGAPGPARVIPDKGWLWVARPDGMVEHNLQVHEFPKGGGPRVGFSPGARLDSGMVCSPDGRHVAISADGEVQVWDLDAGKLKHRLAGHLGGRNSTGIGAIYNADGSRLFTYPFARALGSVGPEPVHVWDTATGRELLTINVQPDDRQFGSMKVELVGEKLYLRTPNGGVRVLDGTPVKP
jgi:WD40 repeat protein